MKKYFVIAFILFLFSACSKQPVSPAQNQNQPTPNQQATSSADQTAGWNFYASPDKYGFSFKYPSDFGFSTDVQQVRTLAYIPVCDDGAVACAFITRDNYPDTNFDAAGVSVTILKDKLTENACRQIDNLSIRDSGAPTTQTINGVNFAFADGGDAAAGHFSDDKIYRAFHDGSCYELHARVGSTDIDNYPPGTVQQFNQDEIWQQLQAVLGTFEFTR